MLKSFKDVAGFMSLSLSISLSTFVFLSLLSAVFVPRPHLKHLHKVAALAYSSLRAYMKKHCGSAKKDRLSGVFEQ